MENCWSCNGLKRNEIHEIHTKCWTQVVTFREKRVDMQNYFLSDETINLEKIFLSSIPSVTQYITYLFLYQRWEILKGITGFVAQIFVPILVDSNFECKACIETNIRTFLLTKTWKSSVSKSCPKPSANIRQTSRSSA